ncbi:Phosphatidic acid phosphatase (PAP2) family protein [Trifolium repens]|nr:Phosphatidic acid phosphatase (PAP2) family protein [Trifolium repens]
MTATASLCYNPSNNFLRINQPKQRYLRNNSFSPNFSTSRSFTSGFLPMKLLAKSVIDRFVRTAHRDGTTDEHIEVLEQEAFVDMSSELQPKYLFQKVESTLNRLTKWIVSALFGVFVIWRHDAEALWFAGGSVVNAILSVLLKQILNQKRPSTVKSDPGMPSSHSQSIFFAVMFIILSSVELLRVNAFTITSSCLALAFGSYLSYLRVSQKLHTVSQVVVGAVVGSIFSILWYWLWNAFVIDAFVSSLWVRIIVILGSVAFCIGSFNCRFVPIKLWVASAMDESIRTRYKDRKSDEHVKVLEQEAFVDISSEFQPKFLFQEVESTLNHLSKWIVTVLFGVFIIWRHDAEALWFAGGSILNAMFSISLKHILNQKRPSSLKSDPGMPSSHAQSIFFTVIFIILSSVELLTINELTITSSSLVLAFGSYFSYLRVSQKLHTVSQVIVGAVIGSICSILWNLVMFSYKCDLPVA